MLVRFKGRRQTKETSKLMPGAASSVAAWRTGQVMLGMVQVRIATGVTRVVWTAVVLRCGKQMEKLPHYHFSWLVSVKLQRVMLAGVTWVCGAKKTCVCVCVEVICVCVFTLRIINQGKVLIEDLIVQSTKI